MVKYTEVSVEWVVAAMKLLYNKGCDDILKQPITNGCVVIPTTYLNKIAKLASGDKLTNRVISNLKNSFRNIMREWCPEYIFDIVINTNITDIEALAEKCSESNDVKYSFKPYAALEGKANSYYYYNHLVIGDEVYSKISNKEAIELLLDLI